MISDDEDDDAQAIGTAQNLTHIDVADNNFGESAAKLLAEGIAKQKDVHYLDLRDAGLGGEAVVRIVKALAAHPHLHYLDISGNEISEDDMEELAPALGRLTSLKHLHVDDSDEVGESLSSIMNLCKMGLRKLRNLETFSMSFGGVTAAGALALAMTVSRLPSMKVLKLDGNQIAERAVVMLRDQLTQSGRDIALEMHENDEDGDDDLDELDVDDLNDVEDDDEGDEAEAESSDADGEGEGLGEDGDVANLAVEFDSSAKI